MNFKKNIMKVTTMLLALVLVVAMGVCLTACGGSDSDNSDSQEKVDNNLRVGVRYYSKTDYMTGAYFIFNQDGTGTYYYYDTQLQHIDIVHEHTITFKYSSVNSQLICDSVSVIKGNKDNVEYNHLDNWHGVIKVEGYRIGLEQSDPLDGHEYYLYFYSEID